MVLPGLHMDSGSPRELPAVNITAAVSPITLPIPNIIPVIIPGIAAGITTLYIVCHLVAPKAKLPSLYDTGTALIASSEVLIIVGIIIKVRVSPPDTMEYFKLRATTKNTYPNKPNIIEGTPANDSVPNLMIFNIILIIFEISVVCGI